MSISADFKIADAEWLVFVDLCSRTITILRSYRERMLEPGKYCKYGDI